MNPVTLEMMPRNVTPSQNQDFSAILKRHDGTCLPVNSPPALRIHCQSPRCHMLSFTNVKNMITVHTANSGPTKLCKFLDRIASQENNV